MSDWFPPVSTEYGEDCLRCHAAGLTPKNYYVQFQEIKMGDDWVPADGNPPNRLFVLGQTVANDCVWFAMYAPGSSVRYEMGPISTFLRIIVDAPVLAFRSVIAALCRRFHFNLQNVAAGNHFYGGFAMVFTPQEMQDIIEAHTPVVDPDPLLRVSPLIGTQVVISYIDQWGDTKFKMKVDATP